MQGYLSDVDKSIAKDLIGAYRALLLEGGGTNSVQLLDTVQNLAQQQAAESAQAGELYLSPSLPRCLSVYLACLSICLSVCLFHCLLNASESYCSHHKMPIQTGSKPVVFTQCCCSGSGRRGSGCGDGGRAGCIGAGAAGSGRWQLRRRLQQT